MRKNAVFIPGCTSWRRCSRPDATESSRTSTNSCPSLAVCAAESTPGPVDGCGDAANAQGANQPQMFTMAHSAAGLSSFIGPCILIFITAIESFQRCQSREGEFIFFFILFLQNHFSKSVRRNSTKRPDVSTELLPAHLPEPPVSITD